MSSSAWDAFFDLFVIAIVCSIVCAIAFADLEANCTWKKCHPLNAPENPIDLQFDCEEFRATLDSHAQKQMHQELMDLTKKNDGSYGTYDCKPVDSSIKRKEQK